MHKFLFKGLFIILGTLGLGLVVAAFVASSSVSFEVKEECISKPKPPLPQPGFVFPQDIYNRIGKSKLLSLKYTPHSLNLPNLKNVLVYLGKNKRPDGISNTDLYFSLSGSKTVLTIQPNRPYYLVLDRSQSPPKYFFSPDNATTFLWIEASSEDSKALIKVKMRNEKGDLIQEPAEFSKFTLPESEGAKSFSDGWNLGPWKVDQVLLIRQKAKWYGENEFLKTHGGEAFELAKDKQMIEFGEEEERYSLFVNPGDALVWKEDRWRNAELGVDSMAYPLLILNKIDSKVMNWELWDIEGKRKIALNLIKSIEPWDSDDIEDEFSFSGARMRKQFVFEVGSQRMTLRPQDWLLLTDKGWIKISTPQEIDDYVERKLRGTLFIFEDIVRNDNKQYLKGTLFSPSQTQRVEVSLPLEEGKTLTSSHIKREEEEAQDLEEEDSEEFFED